MAFVENRNLRLEPLSSPESVLGRDGVELVPLISQAPEAIFITDDERIIRTWNQGAQDLFGLSPDEAIGQPVSILAPSSSTAEEDWLYAKLAFGDHIGQFETTRRGAGGKIVAVQMTALRITQPVATPTFRYLFYFNPMGL